MKVLTLTAALPSEFVTTAATAGTSSDWLVIQKSGETSLRRLPAQATALGGAALAGSATQDFSVQNLLLPYTGDIWCDGNVRGIEFETGYTRMDCAELRVYNLSSYTYAPVTCGGIACGTGSAVATHFRLTGDPDTGLSSAYNGVMDVVVNNQIVTEFETAGMVSHRIRPAETNVYTVGQSQYSFYYADMFSAHYTTVSDARTKEAITTCDLGLEFITALQPVRYRFKERTVRIDKDPQTGADVIIRGPGIRPHYGLLAQQVKEAMGERDFGGYVYDPDGDGHALRYSEFIAPLIKSVQEEQAARLALEARVKAMEDAGAGAKSPAR